MVLSVFKIEIVRFALITLNWGEVDSEVFAGILEASHPLTLKEQALYAYPLGGQPRVWLLTL